MAPMLSRTRRKKARRCRRTRKSRSPREIRRARKLCRRRRRLPKGRAPTPPKTPAPAKPPAKAPSAPSRQPSPAPQRRQPAPQPAPPPPDPADVLSRPGLRAESPIATYGGSFGAAQAERLLWRAGFGPSPGWVTSLASMGLDAAVESLIAPSGSETFTGAEPTASSGNPLAPEDAYGHDHLFWLDRMVRTNQPFVQRMALIWHDWFATSNAGVENQRLMLGQYELFRRAGRGSFEQLVREVTTDPAMILWLNQNENRRGAINENYARELMELFTLGADRGAYTEQDVGELGRALSGWRADWSPELGWHNFRWDQGRWDYNRKTILGRTGNYNWEHAYRLCVYHSMHPSFFVEKLWSYFIPTGPSEAERTSLEATYVNSGFEVLPVVRAILKHPSLYEGPRMVKPPVVFAAGLLRALQRGVNRTDWYSLCELAGQRLFYPPDVSGWDDSRWLDTSTLRGRWWLAVRALDDRYITSSAQTSYDGTETPEQAVARATAFWGNPSLTDESRASLLAFAGSCLPGSMTSTQQRTYRAQRQNALLQLIPATPDLQTN